MEYTDPTEDVPSPIDLRDPKDARAWVEAAEAATPGRPGIRAAIADALQTLGPGARVLELGSGSGLLAEAVLSRCSNVAHYTLLDFSEPMLEMSRERLSRFPCTRFCHADFKQRNWSAGLGPFSAVLAMQAVHEIRHKRHVPGLYAQLYGMIAPGGGLWVADHTPRDGSLRWTCLHMTVAEQRSAFESAGFEQVRLLTQVGRLALIAGRKPALVPD